MTTTKIVAPALRELLDNLFDYAGLFPPAKLSLKDTLSKFESYHKGEYSWMLRNVVLPASELASAAEALDGKLAVITDKDERRATTIESSQTISAHCPVYCEVATDKLELLVNVQKEGCFAKIRMGGLKPEAIPAPSAAAAFIQECARLRLPFKATAGLHHPIRAEHNLTYDPDSPRAMMHGFLNLLLASAFAWQGKGDVEAILSETDPTCFSFNGSQASWRGMSLSLAEIKDARENFIHSIGSCSFEEPIADLKKLALL